MRNSDLYETLRGCVIKILQVLGTFNTAISRLSKSFVLRNVSFHHGHLLDPR